MIKELIFNQTVFMSLPSKIVLDTNVGIYPYSASTVGGYFDARAGQSFDCYGVYHELDGGYIKKGYYYLILHDGNLCVVPFNVASPKWGGKTFLNHVWKAFKRMLTRNEVSVC